MNDIGREKEFILAQIKPTLSHRCGEIRAAFLFIQFDRKNSFLLPQYDV